MARDLFHVTYSRIVRIFLRSKFAIACRINPHIIHYFMQFPISVLRLLPYTINSVSCDLYLQMGMIHFHGKLFSKTQGTKCQTLHFSVPSEGPGHVEYKIISPDSVDIEWSEISQEHHNGVLLGFYIAYQAQCSDEER